MVDATEKSMAGAQGAVMKATVHRMGRRCRDWDYSRRRIYMITIVLDDAWRARGPLGHLVRDADGAWRVEPSPQGVAVLAAWRKMQALYPQVSLMGEQLMPDHFHGIVFVKAALPPGKSLGSLIRGFKAGASSAWKRPERPERPERPAQECVGARPGVGVLGRGITAQARCASAQSCAEFPAEFPAEIPRWAPGYVDLILWRDGQLQRMIDYLHDNPRRLAEKRAHASLFKVVRAIDLAFRVGPETHDWHGPNIGRFSGIGNHALLAHPILAQVQCSRVDLRYRRAEIRGGGRKIVRTVTGEPVIEHASDAFEKKAAHLLALAQRGAVLVSPCISDGEREIARRALAAGARLVTLHNNGFHPLFKPGGRSFEACAAGRLLMLAPAAWPHLPGNPPLVRDHALVLNRLAQLLTGEGASPLNYHGRRPVDIDRLAMDAVR